MKRRKRGLEALLDQKPIYRAGHRAAWGFLCPNCRGERRIRFGKSPYRVKAFLQVGLTAGVSTLLTWPLLDWKGVIVALPLWVGYEVWFRLSRRAALKCPYCGFDPVLYLVDVKRARAEIEAFWEKRLKERGISIDKDTKSQSAHSGEGQTSA